MSESDWDVNQSQKEQKNSGLVCVEESCIHNMCAKIVTQGLNPLCMHTWGWKNILYTKSTLIKYDGEIFKNCYKITIAKMVVWQWVSCEVSICCMMVHHQHSWWVLQLWNFEHLWKLRENKNYDSFIVVLKFPENEHCFGHKKATYVFYFLSRINHWVFKGVIKPLCSWMRCKRKAHPFLAIMRLHLYVFVGSLACINRARCVCFAFCFYVLR